MKKRTTTKQIQQAITEKLLNIISAEKYNKSTRKTDLIDADTFIESLEFLCETLFADCVGWHYERNNQTGQYIVEAGRMDGDVEVIVTAYLCANEGVSREVIDKALRVIEEE